MQAYNEHYTTDTIRHRTNRVRTAKFWVSYQSFVKLHVCFPHCCQATHSCKTEPLVFSFHFLVGLWKPGWCSVMKDSWSVQSNCCLLSDMLFLVLYFELARIRIMRMNINSLENHRISTIQLANRSVTSFGSFQQQTQKYIAVHLTPDIAVDA